MWTLQMSMTSHHLKAQSVPIKFKVFIWSCSVYILKPRTQTSGKTCILMMPMTACHNLTVHTKYFGVKNVSLDTFFLCHCFWHSKLTQLTQHNRYFDIAYVITFTLTHLRVSIILRHTWMSQVRQKREAQKGLWVTPPNRHFAIVCQLWNNSRKWAHSNLD